MTDKRRNDGTRDVTDNKRRNDGTREKTTMATTNDDNSGTQDDEELTMMGGVIHGGREGHSGLAAVVDAVVRHRGVVRGVECFVDD